MHRTSKRQNRRPLRGFTLVEIMIVVMIIGVLLNIAAPGLIRAREGSRAKSCQSNLQKIQGAKEMWAMDTRAAVDAAPSWVHLAGSTRYLKARPVCQNGGSYTIRALQLSPSCSIGTNTNTQAFDDHVLP